MKTLKTKRVNVVVCLGGLRNMPPKDFPSVGEMEKTADILELLKESIPEFVKILDEGEKLNIGIQKMNLTDEEMMAKRADYQKRANLLEEQKGDQEVSVEFENETFNTFFQQCERWGKLWFIKLEPYLAFRKDMTTANSQPKGK